MIFPPSLMRLRIVEKGSPKISLWLPLLLLWPLIPLLAVTIPVVLICLRAAKKVDLPVLPATVGVFTILFALRGLRVDVKDPKDEVHIVVI